MKNYKRTFAAMTAGLLALTPCFAAGMTAVAATLTVTDADTAAHTYNAYQIIKGKMNNEKLTELEWGNGIDPTLLINALNNNKDDLGITDTIADNATPQTVAEVLSKITDADKKNKLAKVIASAKTDSKTGLTKSDNDYSSSALDVGWYLILDETTSLNTADPDTVRSANILQITQDTAINTKHSMPTLEKKIVEGQNLVDANTAAIGDAIDYQITLKVPDVTGYDKYFYVVEDTFSDGLDYQDDMTITIAGVTGELEQDTDGPNDDTDTGDFYVTENGNSIKVVFVNAVNLFKNKTVGNAITLTYSAKLTENANLDPNTGNPNKAKLVYSNDPNITNTGTPGTTPDEPDNDDVVGETPEDKVNTYTTAIKIKKVDQDGNPLKGATFTLYGNNLNKVRSVTGSSFTASDTGTYWKLKNGSYTTTDPTSLTDAQKAKYEDLTQKYAKSPATATKDKVSTSGDETTIADFKIVATVDEDGYLTFEGLNAGSYTLSETGVPEGYNKAEDIAFTLTADPIDENAVTWTNSSNKFSGLDTEYMFLTEIENREGATLPSTGGIGTKLFYLFGGMLVVGSSVVLITKKRMSADDN